MALLDVEDLTVAYGLGGDALRAVEGVSFSLGQGESLGLVGESGCGKSTVAAALLGLLPSNASVESGSVRLDGVDLLAIAETELRAVRWDRMSMIFQSSMSAMNPVLRVSAIFREVLDYRYGVNGAEATARIGRLFDMVGLPRSRMQAYPHELSGGMRQRVVIALSLLCEPDIVIADEPTTALDALVQAQIMKELASLRRELGFSMVLVSHDIGLIYENCDRVAVMYAGEIIEIGDREAIFHHPQHPYLVSLLSAVPSLEGDGGELASLPGSPPDLVAPPPGCRFHPRCPVAVDRCRVEVPAIVGPTKTRCHLPGELLPVGAHAVE